MRPCKPTTQLSNAAAAALTSLPSACEACCNSIWNKAEKISVASAQKRLLQMQAMAGLRKASMTLQDQGADAGTQDGATSVEVCP
eukprot:scaffold118084_cov19-Tisochrysis_lutea.AAC.1